MVQELQAFRQRVVSTSRCADNEFVAEIGTDGTAVCRPTEALQTNVSCPAGSVLTGLRRGFALDCSPDSGLADFDLVFSHTDVVTYVRPPRAVIPPLQALTLTFWVNSARPGGNLYLLSYFATADNDLLVNLSPLAIRIKNVNVALSSTSLNDGTWHFVSIAWNQATATVQAEVDGVSVYSNSVTIPTVPGGGQWILGQEQDSLGGG